MIQELQVWVALDYFNLKTCYKKFDQLLFSEKATSTSSGSGSAQPKKCVFKRFGCGWTKRPHTNWIRHFNFIFILLITFDIVWQATSQGFPHLEELSVAGVVEGISSQPFIDDEALQRIIKSSKKLRLLDVRGCNKVSDSSLVRIPAWDLEHIFLSGKAFSF